MEGLVSKGAFEMSQEPFVPELTTRWQPSREPSGEESGLTLERACGGRSAWKRITDSPREC